MVTYYLILRKTNSPAFKFNDRYYFKTLHSPSDGLGQSAATPYMCELQQSHSPEKGVALLFSAGIKR